MFGAHPLPGGFEPRHGGKVEREVDRHHGVEIGQLEALGGQVDEPLDHHRPLLLVRRKHDLRRHPVACLRNKVECKPSLFYYFFAMAHTVELAPD